MADTDAWKLGRPEIAVAIVDGLLGHLDPQPSAVLPFDDTGISILWSPGIDDETAHVAAYVFGDGSLCLGWMMADGCRNDDWTLPHDVTGDVVSAMVRRLLDVVRLIDEVDRAVEVSTHAGSENDAGLAPAVSF